MSTRKTVRSPSSFAEKELHREMSKARPPMFAASCPASLGITGLPETSSRSA
jgi:hypothetical protein